MHTYHIYPLQMEVSSCQYVVRTIFQKTCWSSIDHWKNWPFWQNILYNHEKIAQFISRPIIDTLSSNEKLDCRDLDRIGAVGAIAPTDFEESSFFTLNYHQKSLYLQVFGSVSENLHPQFRNPN